MMKHTLLAMLVLSLLVPVTGFGQTTTETSSSPFSLAPTPVDENLAIRVLRQPVEEVDWVDLPLSSVFIWLRDQGDVNVLVDWTALQASGASEDALVNLSLKDTTVGVVLREAVEQVNDQVRYRATKNNIRISTKDKFNEKLHIRVYDVTDILFRVPEFYDAPEIDLAQAQQSGGASSGGSGQPVFETTGGGDDDDEGNDDQELLQRMEELRTLIELTIEPDFWDTVGGPGAIVPYNRVLVVRASVEVHEEIAGFFAFE